MSTPSAEEHNGLFVMLLLDGHSYGYISTPMSHGPLRERITAVDNINEATALPRAQWRPWLRNGVLVPVTVSRKVTIIPG